MSIPDMAGVTNRVLANRIHRYYKDPAAGQLLDAAMAEAEARGIKLTVAMTRTTVYIAGGARGGQVPPPDEHYTIDKHPFDVAAGLEDL